MSNVGVRVEGLADFRKALGRADKDANKEFGLAQRKVKDLVVGDARTIGRTSKRGPLRHFSRRAGISGTSTAKDSKTGIAGVAILVKNPDAMAAFMGSGGRTGWYAAGKFSRSKGRQFAPHVGNTWEVGGPGGPYAINPAIRQNLEHIDRMILDAVQAAGAQAFDE